MELSRRLTAVAGMVTEGNVVCDVGCDHGYVSIYLIKQGISPHVIAMDVRKGPLSHAKKHIDMYGLCDYIETRLSDGMDELQTGEADTLIMAGMGGRLMEDIITRGMNKVEHLKELILQPQSEIGLFRKFLRDNGLKIVEEDMVYEDGKYYSLMRAVSGKQAVCQDTVSRIYDLYGEILLTNRHPVLKQYLDYQHEKLRQLLDELSAVSAESEKSRKRIEEVKNQLLLNQLAREMY